MAESLLPSLPDARNVEPERKEQTQSRSLATSEQHCNQVMISSVMTVKVQLRLSFSLQILAFTTSAVSFITED